MDKTQEQINKQILILIAKMDEKQKRMEREINKLLDDLFSLADDNDEDKTTQHD